MAGETKQLYSELSKGAIIQIGTVRGTPMYTVLDAATKALICGGEFAIIKGKPVFIGTAPKNQALAERVIRQIGKRRTILHRLSKRTRIARPRSKFKPSRPRLK